MLNRSVGERGPVTEFLRTFADWAVLTQQTASGVRDRSAPASPTPGPAQSRPAAVPRQDPTPHDPSGFADWLTVAPSRVVGRRRVGRLA